AEQDGETCMQTLGLGFTWEQLAPGQRFRTLNRTLTETDLVMFTGVTGMLETIFIDRTFGSEKGAIQGQFVPAALTYSLIEGLLCQTMIQGSVLDMDAAAGDKVVTEIKSAGGRASLHAADITDYDAVARAVEGFESAAGPVACLVNNAGWDRAASFLDTTPEFWRQVVAVNLFGPLNVNHIVLRGMAARGF